MISASAPRRRGAFAWSSAGSLFVHLLLILVISLLVRHFTITEAARESVAQTTLARIERRPRPTPPPVRHRAALPHVRRVVRSEVLPAAAPRHELARAVVVPATPQPPQRAPHRRAPSLNLARDEAGFSREVARLNAANDAHAVPTIDPATRGPSEKSYSFSPASSQHGQDSGNGIIIPVRRWKEGDDDCYYGRYEFTYPSGAEESGDIVWPFCFDAASDPFKQSPHLIPFPLPLPGYRLPSGTFLPPIEKSVYQQWAAQNGGAPR